MTHRQGGRSVRGSTDTLVLGIGNTQLGDDGAGVHALRHVERLLGGADGVEFLDGSALTQALLPTLERFERWIVLDASNLQRTPGTIETFEGPDMDEFLARPRRATHETSLAEVVTGLRQGGKLPARRALVAIQPDRVDPAPRPSRRVTAVLDEAAVAAISFICHWDAEAGAPA
jgi:hydrogenase maturation protease